MKLKGFLNYPVQRGEDRVAHNQGTSRRGGSVAGELNFGKSKNTLRVPRGQSVCEVIRLHQQQMCFLWGWGVGGGSGQAVKFSHIIRFQLKYEYLGFAVLGQLLGGKHL